MQNTGRTIVIVHKGELEGKVDANTIMLNLVDGSDEVVPTTDRVVKARIVHRAG